MKKTTNSPFNAMTEEQQEAFFNADAETNTSGKKKISKNSPTLSQEQGETMHLSTNGINISALPIEIIEIKPKSIEEYREEIQKTIDKIREDGKKGIAVFTDT